MEFFKKHQPINPSDLRKTIASFKNGVLNIDIPKVEPELPKKIFVRIS